MEKAVPLDTPTPPSSPLPPGIPDSAAPSPEFLEAVKRIEGQTEEPTKASQHPPELPEAQPLKLTYKYVGECPEHRTPVDTLELDVAKSHFCIAYCASGKHQIESREVVKL